MKSLFLIENVIDAAKNFVIINMATIYFLIFLNNLSVNKSFIEYKKFKEIIEVDDVSKNYTEYLRNQIKKMHK